MKPLTQKQKDAIISTIKSKNSEFIDRKKKEMLDSLALSIDEEAYLDQLKRIESIERDIDTLTEQKEQICTAIASNPLYNYSEAYYRGDRETKFKDRMVTERMKKMGIKEPSIVDYNNMETEMEIMTISKDFDVESFIDRFTIK